MYHCINEVTLSMYCTALERRADISSRGRSKQSFGSTLQYPYPLYMCPLRVLQQAADAEAEPDCVMDFEKLLRSRLTAAVQLRRSLRLPSEATNVYRLCNR